MGAASTASRRLRQLLAAGYVVLSALWAQSAFNGFFSQDISPPNLYYGGHFCHRTIKSGVEQWHADGLLKNAAMASIPIFPCLIFTLRERRKKD